MVSAFIIEVMEVGIHVLLLGNFEFCFILEFYFDAVIEQCLLMDGGAT